MKYRQGAMSPVRNSRRCSCHRRSIGSSRSRHRQRKRCAASGADFTTVGVDPLALGNPLDLLGQEDLPGFTITNLLATEFINGTPTALTNAALTFDEDGLPGGNLGGIGDLDPTTNGPISATGTLGHNYGPDQNSVNKSTLFVGTGAPEGFIYTVSNGGLVLTVSQIQNGASVDVLRLTLSNAIDGNYTIQQLHAIDHAPGGNENNQAFTFHYVVTDSNGDTNNDGTLALTVNDDSPTVAANAPITFDEDALPGGNPAASVTTTPAITGRSRQLARLRTVSALTAPARCC